MAASHAPGRKKAETRPIDHEKLRAMLRRIGDEYIFYMLDDAIEQLPPTKLAKIVGRYIRLDQVSLDEGAPAARRSLLEEVTAFVEVSRRGGYYVDFDVSSKNCTETSTGTRAFIADCRRLLERCMATARKRDRTGARESFELLFALLRHIDEGHDDVVFFADEGGSSEVCVDWGSAFSAWFRCLAPSATPEEFADAVVEQIDALDRVARNAHLANARKLGTPAQQRALDARLASNAPRRSGG